MQTGTAEVNGARIFYEVAGEGSPVVLVHAGIADRRMWDGQFEVFARRYRVVRYDRRGFGKTLMTRGPYSHHDDLYGLLQSLNIERAAMVGSSQGGKAVTDFALEHPLMVSALVLTASALGGFEFAGEYPPQWKELEEADEASDIGRVNELELQLWVDGRGRTAREVDPQVRELVRQMNLIALRAPADLGQEQPLEPAAVQRLNEIHAPALIVVGDLDVPKTLAAAEVLAEKIPSARKVVIPGTAHLPNMERPAEFNRHVLSFLDDVL